MPRETLLRAWLGQQVAVVVDRPMVSSHPEHPNTIYPVNYGYIPGTQAGDEQPVDVYVIGVSVPVSSFLGEVIAIVVRHDDIEDKLVVVPAGTRTTAHEIREAVMFQEQYFDIEVVMAVDQQA
ncbi:inorganic pyrophosphatase [soil metagenome]